MLTRILTTIQKDGAVFFPAVDERSLRFVSSLLASHRFPPLPLDYVALLKQTDGLSLNGVELYGTRANDREAKGYTLPGLIEANLEFSNAAPMQGKLLLGRAAEELFVYDSVDTTSSTVWISQTAVPFRHFPKLFTCLSTNCFKRFSFPVPLSKNRTYKSMSATNRWRLRIGY